MNNTNLRKEKGQVNINKVFNNGAHDFLGKCIISIYSCIVYRIYKYCNEVILRDNCEVIVENLHKYEICFHVSNRLTSQIPSIRYLLILIEMFFLLFANT